MLQCYVSTTTSVTEQHCGNLTVVTCASYQFLCQNDILCTYNENLNNSTKCLYRIMTNESCLALSSIPQHTNVICCHKNICNNQGLDDLTGTIPYSVLFYVIIGAVSLAYIFMSNFTICVLFVFMHEVFNSIFLK
ncbi:unnamed protein product [Adineta ricciae]|uniref:Uncharacterized protein n=1 Tax=Adineta ricciae TaxID=249248 RepID=A0A815Q694_ADIRI|nr:unnamed protein product [Adineta ricciae]